MAHRLSIIRQCDRIVVLDRWKEDIYDELLEKERFFCPALLVARQQLDT